jgi:hypothetical protein
MKIIFDKLWQIYAHFNFVSIHNIRERNVAFCFKVMPVNDEECNCFINSNEMIACNNNDCHNITQTNRVEKTIVKEVAKKSIVINFISSSSSSFSNFNENKI